MQGSDGELEWTDAQSRLSSDDVLTVVGSACMGVGAVLAVVSIFLFKSDSGVTVSARGSQLVVGGSF